MTVKEELSFDIVRKEDLSSKKGFLMGFSMVGDQIWTVILVMGKEMMNFYRMPPWTQKTTIKKALKSKNKKTK